MKKVLLLLAEGFEVFEASVFIDVMGWNLNEGDGSTRLYSCGLRKEIKSSFDQRFIMDYVLEDLDLKEFDALAVPGGFENYGFYKDAYDERFLSVIRAFKTANKPIASICVGALALGKSGVLEGKKGTTYNNPVRREALRNFGVDVVHQPIVKVENIITSWNPSTAVDVALLLLEKLTSAENSRKVRSLMGF
jgi:4-methyl-5(b-hydroxyethyl)-thiazole monophosphate biosynthesis